MRAAVASVGEAMAYRAADLVAQCDIPKPQKMADGVGIPYGRMNVAMLHLLARIGARYGNGNWQVMRSRALILGEVTDPAALAEEAQAGGLIARADDPRRRISACTGRSGCASATVDTRQDADALQSALPPLATLHVSGCPKGCAHPGSADFTLVGTASGYDLVRNGRAGDAPASRGLTLTEARAHLRAAAL
jgi:precorrin-3B synthase